MNVKLSKAVTIVENNILAQLKGYNVPPTVMAGDPGTGKTSLVKQIAKKYKLSLINVSMASLTSEQLSGIPDFNELNSFNKYLETDIEGAKGTVWSVPEIILSANLAAENNSNGVVLLLDDIHRVSMATMPYLYELLLERKLGRYLLSENVAIVGTMNISDKAGFDGMDSPVRSRLGILPIEFDFDFWFENFGITLHPIVSSFAKAYKSDIIEEESTGIEGFNSPRSLEFLSNTIYQMEDKYKMIDYYEELAIQYMSNNVARKFYQHAIFMEKINFKDLVRSKKVIKIDDDIISQIGYSYLIKYVETKEDAQFLIDFINANKNASTFIGLLSSILYSMFSSDNLNEAHKYYLNAVVDLDFEDVTEKLTIQDDLKQLIQDSMISFILEK